MSPNPSHHVDPSLASEERHWLETSTPGLSDAFGDRMLTFDRRTATSLELLRFNREFSESEPFEAALRARVAQTRLEDPSIASPRSVERWDGSLVLVSRYVSGNRLSELLTDRRGPMSTLDCVRRIVPLLATLADATGTYAHGALAPERVSLGRDNRLVLSEHPLGAAVEALRWPAARVRAQLEIVVPGDDAAEFTARIDPIQVGFLALSLLLGRRIHASEYPANIGRLLDESVDAKRDGTGAALKLRGWIERALQIGPRPLESAREALQAFGELTGDKDARRKEPVKAVEPAPSPVPPPIPKPVVPAPTVSVPPSAPPRISAPAPSVPAVAPKTPAIATAVAPQDNVPTKAAAPRTPVSIRAKSFALAAVTMIAIAEAVVIGAMWYFKPVAAVQAARQTPQSLVEPASSAAPMPNAMAPTPDAAPKASVPPAVPVRPAPPPPAAAPVPAPAPAVVDRPAPKTAASPAGSSPRVGGMTFTSALDLQVFENGKRIGASGGPIAATEGVHTVELVNESLGFRVQETVTIKPGELMTRTISVPNGRLSVNAVPWADVWIDGSPAGQTPLANLSIPIGEHQITFRHPQLGEQRETAVVRSDGVTRLSTRMQK